MRIHRRSFAVLAVLAVVALALTSVALAGSGSNHHKRNHKIAQLVKKDVKKLTAKKRRTFAPTRIIGAAESSAVLLDPLTQQFMQVTFDRGRVTAVANGSITLQQHQGAVLWRTQSFTVPTNAVVTLNGHSVQLTQIPTGANARVESSGTPGGSLTVVRVNAYSHGEAPLPPAS